MKIDFAQMSEAGPRKENQDSVVVDSDEKGAFLFVVADGLGGHKGGKEASNIAAEMLKENWKNKPLHDIFLDIHSDLKNAQESNDEFLGMATTATAVVAKNGSIVGAHCGDTRCSILRGSGIKRLTVEHTEAQRLYDAGKLTKEEFLQYPRRNILDQALGGDRIPAVDTFQFDLQEQDKIVITSDGIHEKIRQREILDLTLSIDSANRIVEKIGVTVQNKSPEDNYSLVCAIINELN